jgi:hypothetical protein
MCHKCFLSDFPREIIQKYDKRKWEYRPKEGPKGKIEHLRFFPQEGKHNEQFWKGIEKVRFDSDGRIEYRFCYWANLGKGWKWGQFCPFYPKDILDKVLDAVKVLDSLSSKEM